MTFQQNDILKHKPHVILFYGNVSVILKYIYYQH